GQGDGAIPCETLGMSKSGRRHTFPALLPCRAPAPVPVRI
ncbi:hypothetical protein AVDCRST_MAG82-2485, partial [uncultured Rubrobacteraceae bacterium]